MEKKTESFTMVMIDSSIFIDHIRGYKPAVEFFQSFLSQENNASFSALTETELLS